MPRLWKAGIDMTEAELQRACNETLRQLGIPYFHYEKGCGKNLTHRGGIPDLIFFHKGNAFAIELKAEGGNVSDAQTVTLKKLHDNGVHTRICFTHEAFIGILKEYNIIT